MLVGTRGEEVLFSPLITPLSFSVPMPLDPKFLSGFSGFCLLPSLGQSGYIELEMDVPLPPNQLGSLILLPIGKALVSSFPLREDLVKNPVLLCI